MLCTCMKCVNLIFIPRLLDSLIFYDLELQLGMYVMLRITVTSTVTLPENSSPQLYDPYVVVHPELQLFVHVLWTFNCFALCCTFNKS